MEKKYYLIEVEGGIEPFSQGPSETEDGRDDITREIRAGMDGTTAYSGLT